MKLHLRNGNQNGGLSDQDATGNKESGSDSKELKSDLQMFRESLRAAAEKPDSFWADQRTGIMEKLERPAPVSGRRPALLWIPAAVVIVMCLFFFVEKSKAPTPDFAAGSDQILLIEVERALRRDCPEALAPAALIAREIARADRPSQNLSVKK